MWRACGSKFKSRRKAWMAQTWWREQVSLRTKKIKMWRSNQTKNYIFWWSSSKKVYGHLCKYFSQKIRVHILWDLWFAGCDWNEFSCFPILYGSWFRTRYSTKSINKYGKYKRLKLWFWGPLSLPKQTFTKRKIWWSYYLTL